MQLHDRVHLAPGRWQSFLTVWILNTAMKEEASLAPSLEDTTEPTQQKFSKVSLISSEIKSEFKIKFLLKMFPTGARVVAQQ